MAEAEWPAFHSWVSSSIRSGVQAMPCSPHVEVVADEAHYIRAPAGSRVAWHNILWKTYGGPAGLAYGACWPLSARLGATIQAPPEPRFSYLGSASVASGAASCGPADIAPSDERDISNTGAGQSATSRRTHHHSRRHDGLRAAVDRYVPAGLPHPTGSLRYHSRPHPAHAVLLLHRLCLRADALRAPG